jgi:hypothetical protein
MSEQLTDLLAATQELPDLLTEHTPTAATHHMSCGAPWMTSQTAEEDGTVTSRLVCPVCATS